jgi:hypothetical protein
VATPEELRVWAAESRLWAAQTQNRDMADKMRALADEMVELARIKDAFERNCQARFDVPAQG